MIYNLSNVENYKPDITKQAILNITTEEEIFRHYLGFDFKLSRMYNSPLRKDQNPSFNIYYAPNGEMRFKDFNGEQGTCFDLVMIMNGLRFNECLKAINYDMNLGLENSYNTKEIKRIKYTNFREKILEEKKECLIQFKPQHFTDKDLEYWKEFNIDYNILKRYNVYSSKYIFVNKKLVLTYYDTNPIYCYSLPNNKVKVYRPFADKGKYKWLSNATNNEIQGLYQLEYDSDTIVITKSMKDVMCLRQFGIHACSPASEVAEPEEKILADLSTRFYDVVTLMDFDYTGIKMANKLYKQYNFKPLFLTNGIFGTYNYKAKDISDFYEMYGHEHTQALINESIITLNKKNGK